LAGEKLGDGLYGVLCRDEVWRRVSAKMDLHGQSSRRSLPPGIVLLRRLRDGRDLEYSNYRASLLVITFIAYAYAFFHMSRKPPSIVKSMLDPERQAAFSLSAVEIVF
jgi:hypothetical protein